MIKSLLKGLAISFGGGLALGAGIKIGQGSAKSTAQNAAPVDLNPLLERLNTVEHRIVEVESSVLERAGLGDGASVATLVEHAAKRLEGRIGAQLGEVERLRREILSVEEHSTEHLDRLTQKLVELESRIPGLIETGVSSRVVDLETRLHRDFEDAHAKSMEVFADTIQKTVVQRISSLEGSLADQSDAIGRLRDASLKTDQNLQKMLIGIEKLCDQKTQASYQPAPEPLTARPTEARGPEPRGPEPTRPPSPQMPIASIAPPPQRRVHGSERGAHPVGATSAPVEPATPAGTPSSPEPPSRLDPIALKLLKPEPAAPKRWRIPLIVSLLVFSVALLAMYFFAGLPKAPADTGAPNPSGAVTQDKTASIVASDSGQAELQALEARAGGDPTNKTMQLELAREYVNRKDWARAEVAYRGVLLVDSEDKTALLALSDVLYQQHKYEESAAVLSKLSPAKNP